MFFIIWQFEMAVRIFTNYVNGGVFKNVLLTWEFALGDNEGNFR